MPDLPTTSGRNANPPTRTRGWAIGLGFAAAIAFALLASVRLSAQGPEYDELHQAVGAFT